MCTFCALCANASVDEKSSRRWNSSSIQATHLARECKEESMALWSSADHSFHSARPLIYTQRAVRAIAHSTRLDARNAAQMQVRHSGQGNSGGSTGGRQRAGQVRGCTKRDFAVQASWPSQSHVCVVYAFVRWAISAALKLANTPHSRISVLPYHCRLIAVMVIPKPAFTEFGSRVHGIWAAK